MRCGLPYICHDGLILLHFKGATLGPVCTPRSTAQAFDLPSVAVPPTIVTRRPIQADRLLAVRMLSEKRATRRFVRVHLLCGHPLPSAAAT